MSLVSFGQGLDMNKMWAGDCGMYISLCKSCMTKFIKELPERNVYDQLHWQKRWEKLASTLEQARSEGRLPQIQICRAELDWHKEMLEQQAGAMMAGLLQQQLRMMVKNARDTIKKEQEDEVGSANDEMTNDGSNSDSKI